jgi:glucose/arabinose dehydrogenase
LLVLVIVSLPVVVRSGPGATSNAFVGEHGSWDRSVLNGYKVVYIPFSNGRPSGMAEDVVTGFLTNGDEARGRPVGGLKTEPAAS